MPQTKLNHKRLPIGRAVGVEWCMESDVFQFCIIVNERPPTRRGILSVISSVYDPPFTLPAKKVLQDFCHDSLG